MLALIKHKKENNNTKILKKYYKFSKLFEELDDDYYLLKHKL